MLLPHDGATLAIFLEKLDDELCSLGPTWLIKQVITILKKQLTMKQCGAFLVFPMKSGSADKRTQARVKEKPM